MSASASTATRPPGRPRSVRAEQAIIEAVLSLLAEGNTVEALSIEAVAARAGVGKSTIYRRWPGKEALLVDAISTVKRPLPQPRGDSVREDLVRVLTLAPKPQDQRITRIMSSLLPDVHTSPERYRLYQGMVEPRRELIRQVLRRGVGSGQLRTGLDIEVAVAVLTAPVLIQRMLRWHPGLDEETLPARVVDMVLAGIAG